MIRKIAQANAILLVQYAAASLVPLLLIPHIVRVIGLVEFGRIAVIMAWSLYGAAAVQYAFQLTGPKRIMQPGKGESTKDVFINITAAKFLLLIIVTPILVTGAMILPSLRPNKEIEWLLLLSAPVAAFMNSSWLLQCKDKFTALAALGITGSVTTLLIGFTYINHENECAYTVAVIVSVFGILFISLGTLTISIYIVTTEKYAFSISMIIETIKDGWHLFISQFTSLLYTGSGPIVLNHLLGSESAGAYSVMERMSNAIMAAALLTHTAAYPKLAAAYINDRKKYLEILGLLILLYLVVSIIFSITAIFYKEEIIIYLYGEVNQERTILLYLGLLWLVLGIFGTALTGYLTVAGKKNEIWALTLRILGSSMLLGVVGVLMYGSAGWFLGLVLSQIFVLTLGLKHWNKEYGEH